MDHADEFREVGRHLPRGPTVVDIVSSGPEEDLLGLMGEDESVGEVGGVHDLGAAEAAVDDLVPFSG